MLCLYQSFLFLVGRINPKLKFNQIFRSGYLDNIEITLTVLRLVS